jgi:hypothetical protein
MLLNMLMSEHCARGILLQVSFFDETPYFVTPLKCNLDLFLTGAVSPFCLLTDANDPCTPQSES